MLVGINKFFSILFVSLFYSSVSLISFYRNETENYINKLIKENIVFTIDTDRLFTVLLIITLIVSVKCIVFLFDDTEQTNFDVLISLTGQNLQVRK